METMIQNNRESFIQTIREALKDVKTGREGGDPFSLCRSDTHSVPGQIEKRSREERLALLETLKAEALPLNLHVETCTDVSAAAGAIRKTVQEKAPEWGNRKSVVAWRHPLIISLKLESLLAEDGVPVHYSAFSSPDGIENDGERGEIRRKVIDAYIGVTGADYCVAESATLVLKTRPGQARSVSLVPSIHIAVIRLEQILSSFRELYALLTHDPKVKEEGLTNCMTFISGPSKTADIEACMVHGAHGPREMYLFVVTG